jgi:hypothetical protein
MKHSLQKPLEQPLLLAAETAPFRQLRLGVTLDRAWFAALCWSLAR